MKCKATDILVVDWTPWKRDPVYMDPVGLAEFYAGWLFFMLAFMAFIRLAAGWDRNNDRGWVPVIVLLCGIIVFALGLALLLLRGTSVRLIRKTEWNRMLFRSLPPITIGLLMSIFGFMYVVFGLRFDILVLPLFGILSGLAGAFLADAFRRNDAASGRTLALEASKKT